LALVPKEFRHVLSREPCLAIAILRNIFSSSSTSNRNGRNNHYLGRKAKQAHST
jgi:hypothetical protein